MRALLSDILDDAAGMASSPAAARRLRRWARGWAGALALVLLCAAVYVPGLTAMPPLDRDEPRFAQASRQMFESVALPEDDRHPAAHAGGVVIPRIGEQDRLNKPPLAYWLQAGSAAALTGGRPHADAIWMYRVPSVLSATLAVLLTWLAGRRMFDARAAWLGAALLAACPLVVWDAHVARADQMLLASTAGAMLFLWLTWSRRSWSDERWRRSKARSFGVPLGFWACVGLGVLAKGPITPMVALLTALTLSLAAGRWAWWARLRPIAGLVLLLAMVLPWVAAVSARTGFGDYLRTVLDETIGRARAGRESHGAPPGYHIVLFIVLFWPGSLLTALAVRRGLGRAFRRDTPPDPSIEESDPARLERIAAEAEAAANSRLRRLRHRLVRWWHAARQCRVSRDAELFLLAWAVPSWIVFELVWTKLPHYPMPLYPALALLSARAVFPAAQGLLRGLDTSGARAGYVVWTVVGGGLVAIAGVGGVFLGRNALPVPWLGTAGAAAMAAVLALLLARAHRQIFLGRFLRGQLLGLAVAAGLFATVYTTALPRFNDLSTRAVHAIAEIDPDGLRPVAAAGYHEDSLVFLTRGGIERIDPDVAARWLARHPGGLLLTRAKDLDLGPHADPFVLRRLRGYNISKGRFEHLALIDADGYFRFVRTYGLSEP